MLKQRVVHAIRSIGMLDGAEWVRQKLSIVDARADNQAFCREHSDFVPPPLDVMHDAYGTTSFRAYWQVGRYLAQLIADRVKNYRPGSPERLLEWGCGPARILRHLPELLPRTELVGADYNSKSIAWCRAAIKGVTFYENNLSPPLPLSDRTFDAIYAISVLTHISMAQQTQWMAEMHRVARRDGILIMTTNGHRAATVLLPHEAKQLDIEGTIVRGNVAEGKRCFLSYHTPEYARSRLFANFEIVKHIPGVSGAPATEQDIWILRPQ